MSDTDGQSAIRVRNSAPTNLALSVHPRKSRVTPLVTVPAPDEAAGFEVTYHRPNGHDERFRVGEQGLLLGRGEGCDILLGEKFVSRQHARIWVEDGKLWIRDLGSSNGIKINGKRVMGGNISQGGELWVGVARLTAAPVMDSTVRRARIPLGAAQGVEEDILLETSNDRLAVLYRASQLLGTVFDDAELLRKLLGLALESVPGRRGFIIERGADGAISVLAHQSSDGDEQGPPLSRALIGEAINQGDAVLTMDARHDERFAMSMSIMSHEIRAAMCVPLVGRQGICGAIYVDSGAHAARFDENDLALLTAIGRLAGIALENARLHKQAVERERLAALGMATANLGHCMKNIVTGFRCGGEFLAAGIESEDLGVVRKGWPHVARCIERIDGLVMNMLTFGRGDRRWKDSRADVASAVEQAVSTALPRATKYHVDLQFEQPEPLPSVAGDTQELYRVVLNLISNGIEACLEHGGLIRVSAVALLDEIEIRVQDTGPGIPPEVQARLFGPFYTTKGSSGTGLGLSTAKKIVEEHRGSIAVESVPGEGATFIVRLPVVNATAATVQYTPCQ